MTCQCHGEDDEPTAIQPMMGGVQPVQDTPTLHPLFIAAAAAAVGALLRGGR